MTTWEERVAHLSERWATSSRPHRNPPPPVIPAFAGIHAPPPLHPPPRPPQQTNPTPKITQIKRITVGAALVAAHAPPNPPRRPTPSFRRKPETTQPQLPGTARQHQPNCSSPPYRLSGESRNPRTPNSQEPPGNTSLIATPTPPAFPAKAGIHATPTPKDTRPTPA